MYSFAQLIKNEYIKIWKKVSGKVLFILLLLAIIAFPLFIKLVYNISNSDYHSFMDDYSSAGSIAQRCDDQIADIKEDQPENADVMIEFYETVKARGDDVESWMTDGMYGLEDHDRDYITRLTAYVRYGDWRGYTQLHIDDSDSEAEAWAYKYCLEHNIGYGEEFTRKRELIDRIGENMVMAQYDADSDKYKDEVQIGLYQLENELYDRNSGKTSLIEAIDQFWGKDELNFWDVFMLTPYLVTVVGVILIIVAGSIVSSEFSTGTIKFLLMNPVKRWKILMSKYAAVLTLGFIMIAAAYVLSIPMVGIVTGFKGIDAVYLYVKDGKVHEMSSFILAIRSYLLASVSMIVMSTLSFAVSSLLRSSAFAIGASVFLMSFGTSVSAVMGSLGVDWGRYLIFSNTDLLKIYQGTSQYPEHTVFFACTVIVLHMAVFLLTAWDSFTKRSI